MYKWIYFKTEIKKIVREPILGLMFCAPLLLPLSFKLIIRYFIPYLNQYIVFDISPYYPYVVAMAFVLIPLMLGAVMGFAMLDDKDQHILPMIRVTPLGENGYLIIRLILIFISVFIYVGYTFLLLNFVSIPIFNLMMIQILLSIFGSMTGMILFTIATDKVNGLTYAKGLSGLLIFVFADLVPVDWVHHVAAFFPSYWILKILKSPTNWNHLLKGIFVHIVWIVVSYLIYQKKKKH